MKTYWIKQSINLILMVFVFFAMYGCLKKKEYNSAIIDAVLFNSLFTMVCTEKKPK